MLIAPWSRKVIVTSAFSLSCIICLAQIKITGILLDSSGHQLPGATLTLSHGPDDTKKLESISDSTGGYEFPAIAAGKVKLTITSVSYRQKILELMVKKDTFLVLTLSRSAGDLQNATVTASKPALERKIDRFIFNPRKSGMTKGNNVFEILRQTPLVRANEQDGISLLGKTSATAIFINHKKVDLSGENLINFLKALPSDNIDRIELLTIPPPFYDVEGPVIDIIMKKLDINGLIGSVWANAVKSRVSRGGGSSTLTYNNNKFNQTTSLSAGSGNYYKEIYKQSTFYPQNEIVETTAPINSNKKYINLFNNNNYEINPTLTLGSQLIYNNYHTHSHVDGTESVLQENTSDPYDQKIDGKFGTFNGNLFLKYNSESKQRYAELNGNFLTSDNWQQNDFSSASLADTLRTLVPQHLNSVSLKFDFSTKLRNNYVLAGGVKFSHTVTKTPYQSFEKHISHWDTLGNNSSNFDYQENIYTSYITLEKEFSKQWSAKLGLRLDDNFLNTNTQGAITRKTNTTYAYLLPIGYINYSPNQNNNFSLTSKFNSSRPEFSSLNPASILIGVRTITEGNPYLKPSNGGNVEFMYVYHNKYYFGFDYDFSNDNFNQVNNVIPPDTILIKWSNWGNTRSYSTWFFTDFQLSRKWELSIFLNAGYTDRAIYDTSSLGARENNLQSNLSLNNTFKGIFTKGLNMVANITLNSPTQYGLWKQDAGYRIDLGGNYTFKKAGLTLTFMLNDLTKYNDRHQNSVNTTNGQTTRVLNNSDQRLFYISITRSFGNLKTRTIRKHETGNEEERGRL